MGDFRVTGKKEPGEKKASVSKGSPDVNDWQKWGSQSQLSLEKQAALRDKILHKPLQTNNHSEKVGGRGKKYSCCLWFAGRRHRLSYFLQTKHLAQMHLNKTIESFPHFQK